jgi:hypothetical protein
MIDGIRRHARTHLPGAPECKACTKIAIKLLKAQDKLRKMPEDT